MNHASIRTTLAEMTLGPTVSFNNIHVIPVVGGAPPVLVYRSLSDALASGDLVITEVYPQLVWAGKAEHTSFEVPTVSLHVHERIDLRRRGTRHPDALRTDERGLVVYPPDDNVAVGGARVDKGSPTAHNAGCALAVFVNPPFELKAATDAHLVPA